MKEKVTITYEADDGTIFEDREDCINYEKAKDCSRILMFDSDKNPTTSFDYCEYIIIKSAEDVRIIKSYCKTNGYFSPYDQDRWNVPNISEDERGLLIYNGDGWISLNAKIQEIEELKDFLSSYSRS